MGQDSSKNAKPKVATSSPAPASSQPRQLSSKESKPTIINTATIPAPASEPWSQPRQQSSKDVVKPIVTASLSAPASSQPRQQSSTVTTKPKKATRPKGARLTADNVVKILQQVRVPEGWRELEKLVFIGWLILDMSKDNQKEITSSCTTDEQRLQLMVSFWLQKCPYASWRWLIWRLEVEGNLNLAKQIHGFAEPLTDPNLNVKTLMSLLNTLSVVRLGDCLQIPLSKREEIKRHSRSEENTKQCYVKWYCDHSPFATDFTHLAGELYRRGETSVLEQVKRYVQIVPEPILTLSNVTEALKLVRDSKWGTDGLPNWLDIPGSKTWEMERRYPDVSKRKRHLLQHFLDHHPSPSWKLIAYGLYMEEEYGALEVIQRDYFKGSSESRRHFKKAMKMGFVIADIIMLLLFGPAGVGKTCTKAILLGQAIPTLRKSTPLAERAVQVYRAKIAASNLKWEELSREDRYKIVAQAAYSCELDELPEYLEKESIKKVIIQPEIENAEEEPLPKPKKLSHDPSPDPIPSESELQQEASLESTDTPTARPVMATTDEKLLELMDECSLDDPVDKISRVQITDSGGQPQFHEVLPIFLRGTSVYLFFQKLSEKLDEYSKVEYFDENGQLVCTPYQASHTNVQIFQHCLRVLHSQRSKGGEEKPARIIVIGTFKDEAHKCLPETIETKNKRFLDLLLPTFENQIVYSSLQPKRVIFPLNASNPGPAGEKVIDEVRSLITTECAGDPVKVPLQWHALESLLEEIAENLKRDVLTKEECFQVAQEKLHFDEDSFDAALEYLDQLNVIFYFPNTLPNVIFANTQVLLDKVTELVLAIHHLRRGKTKSSFTVSWQRFNDHALVSKEFLAQSHFSKHYLQRCFTQKELVVLFSELLIFAKFNETEFFMPALLHMLSKEEVDDHRVDKSSAAAPVVIAFPGDNVPCLGVFCASVVHLLSSKNHHPCPWELKKDSSTTPSCLYRNCVEFKIPHRPGTVIFIDAFKHFEIHVRLPECAADLASTICPIVRSAVFDALRNADLALHYKISEPSLCLLCPCKVKESHSAQIESKLYICSKDSDVCGRLTPNHLVWSEEQGNASLQQGETDCKDDVPISDTEWGDICPEYLYKLDRLHSERLGGVLGLSTFTLQRIPMDRMPDDMIKAWRTGCDNVLKTKWCKRPGGPYTWNVLHDALKVIKQNGIAQSIFQDRIK